MKTKIRILGLIFVLLYSSLLIQNSFPQWQPDLRLTNASGNSLTSYNNAWCVAANGNDIHAVWKDSRDGNSKIYYKRSTDGGVTWGTDIPLADNTAQYASAAITVSGLNIHIVWYEGRDGNYEIYYKRSTDGGINWGADKRLTNDIAASEAPSIAVSGSILHIVWFDDRNGNREIYYKRSQNSGHTWGADTRLTNNSSESWFPSIAVSGSIVHIVWQDERDGFNGEIFYKCSTDGGLTWGTDTRLTNNTGESHYPSVAVSGTNIHVVWRDNRDGNREIYYKRSTDGGVNWGSDIRLTSVTDDSNMPSIAASGLLVHIVWYDFRNGNYEIYYKLSFNNGIDWGDDTRLTNESAFSWYPSIAVSESNVHIVWSDSRDGNYEIYYKRNPTGNVLPVKLLSFKSKVNDCDVSLSWITSSEIDNSGFNIERKSATEETWRNLAFVPGKGTSNLPVEYNFLDKNLIAGKYNYRLKQIDYNGNFEYFKLENDVIIKEPTKFCLEQNYPNPFNPTTKIRFDVAHPLSYPNVSIGNPIVTLKIFDALGREVETLVNEKLSPGTYEASFNGSAFPSGVYFYRLQAGSFTETKRMTLIK